MDGTTLRRFRELAGWTQVRLAARLGVTQAYLSLMESGGRPIPDRIAGAANRILNLPATTIPMPESGSLDAPVSGPWVEEALARLGYPGLARRKNRPGGKMKNPIELLLRALAVDDLDPRLAEALPWLLLHFDGCDLKLLATEAKMRDLQNRLGFAVALARQVAERNVAYRHRLPDLRQFEQTLERSRLAGEGGYGRGEPTRRGRDRVRRNRSAAATHWNVVTDLKSEDLPYVDHAPHSGEDPH